MATDSNRVDGTEGVDEGISPAAAATPSREGTDKLTGAVTNAAGAALAGKPGSTHENPIVVPSPAAVMALREHLRDNTILVHEDE